jgi:hypothetical protein
LNKIIHYIKTHKIQLFGVAFILLAIGAYVGYSSWDRSVPTTGTATEKKEEYVNITDEREIEEKYQLDMGEAEVQSLIHHMSHQKVKAAKKWGAVLITPALISRLIEIVETNSLQFGQADVYLDILKRWEKGDFSLADKDHNKIWKLQNGTVGKATGLLSSSEEQKYIERNFN